MLPVTQRYGMGVIVWSPLAGGWLTGRYRRGVEFEPGSSRRRAKERPAVAGRFDMTREANQRKLDIVEGLDKVAAQAGVSMTHLSIAFALAHPGVTSAIIGPRTEAQLADLLAGGDVTLDGDTLDAIDAIVPPGEVIEGSDRGWSNPWLEAPARRR